jgi:hypothetical protein
VIIDAELRDEIARLSAENRKIQQESQQRIEELKSALEQVITIRGSLE